MASLRFIPSVRLTSVDKGNFWLVEFEQHVKIVGTLGACWFAGGLFIEELFAGGSW